MAYMQKSKEWQGQCKDSKDFLEFPDNPMGPPDAARNRPLAPWAVSGGIMDAHGAPRGVPRIPMGLQETPWAPLMPPEIAHGANG